MVEVSSHLSPYILLFSVGNLPNTTDKKNATPFFIRLFDIGTIPLKQISLLWENRFYASIRVCS